MQVNYLWNIFWFLDKSINIIKLEKVYMKIKTLTQKYKVKVKVI